MTDQPPSASHGSLWLSIGGQPHSRGDILRDAIRTACVDMRHGGRGLPASDASLIELARRDAGLVDKLGRWLLDGTMDAATAAAYLIVVAAKPREIAGALAGAR